MNDVIEVFGRLDRENDQINSQINLSPLPQLSNINNLTKIESEQNNLKPYSPDRKKSKKVQILDSKARNH